MSYREAPPELDHEFARLAASLALAPGDEALQSSATALAHSLRSRCIDLAGWKADLSPEYSRRLAQAARLTRLAGKQADEVLRREFAAR